MLMRTVMAGGGSARQRWGTGRKGRMLVVVLGAGAGGGSWGWRGGDLSFVGIRVLSVGRTWN